MSDNTFFNTFFQSYQESGNRYQEEFNAEYNVGNQYGYNDQQGSYDYGQGSGFVDGNSDNGYGYSGNYDYGQGSGFVDGTSNTGYGYSGNYNDHGENSQREEETVEGDDGNGVDYSDYFVFEYGFKTFEEAFDRCDEVAFGLGFHLVKAKYHMEKSPPYKLVKCERYGPYVSKAKDPSNPQRKSMTKKNMCPFVLKMIQQALGFWVVKPRCGVHNHHFGVYLEGHRRRAKLTEEQKELIKQYRQSHIKPGMVRHALTLSNPDQPPPTLKQIYNENARLSAKDRDGRNSVQHMLYLSNQANYLTDVMKDSESDKATHVWIAHPEGVQMFKAWPYVICIDSTYNTNKYNLILVQCVGVTPVGKSFLIGYALIKKETKEGYIWVLRRLESLLEPGVRPSVIVTDHERGLIGALAVVFPNTCHFLCLFHVYMAVEAWATNLLKNGTFGQGVAHGAWKKVIEAESFEDCNLAFDELKKRYCGHPELIFYLTNTWWTKLHTFAKCFTNQVLHFGNTTTSRVESAHAQLKMWLGSAKLTLDNIWKRADVMMHGQHIEIRKTLENSISRRVVSKSYYGPIFSMLSGKVSSMAVEAMLAEYHRGVDLGNYLDEECGCTIWITHKLLCACRLHRIFHEHRRVHVDDVHVFWSTLAYNDSSHCRSNPNDVMEELFNKVRSAHQSVQRDVIESLFAKLYPEDEVIEEPETIENKRGRPKKSTTRNKSAFEHSRRRYPSTSTTNDGGDGPPLEVNYDTIPHLGVFPYKDCIPEAVVDGYLGAFDPDGDGHCGFRVLSHAKTGSQRNYIEMRSQLVNELKQPIYDRVYYGERNKACRRILFTQRRSCLRPNWMDADDLLGFATMFNWTICMVISRVNLLGERVWSGSATYLPLRSVPGERTPYGILWVLYTGEHFLRLRMNDQCAMPPIHGLWFNNRDNDVAHYEELYTERLTLWWQYVFADEMYNPFREDPETVVIE